MNLNSKQKIMIGVLGLGVTALICDRTLFAPPESAHATAPPSAEATASTPAAATNATQARSASAISETTAGDASALPDYAGLSGRLTALTSTSTSSGLSVDLFAEPEHWTPPEPTAEPEPAPAARGPIVSSRRFLESYKLASVMDTKLGTVAQINGKEYAQGSTLESFVLRGFVDQPNVGRAALWESLSDGQLVIMPVAR